MGADVSRKLFDYIDQENVEKVKKVLTKYP
jgi:hypothetical protein